MLKMASHMTTCPECRGETTSDDATGRCTRCGAPLMLGAEVLPFKVIDKRRVVVPGLTSPRSVGPVATESASRAGGESPAADKNAGSPIGFFRRLPHSSMRAALLAAVGLLVDRSLS